ncbi:MAG: low specificity L-threonine aldolase [Desulfobacterales bacterium]|nr:low specificity L-threonine aldolase [Desulfobacterales bacterium]
MPSNIRRGFASDNNAGVHPDILAAMTAANTGHTVAYGDDPYTQSAIAQFKRHFGDHIEVFFVYNGTGANVLGLNAATRPYHSIICAESAHIHVDECGAPERFTGCKLLSIPTSDGKITVDQIKSHYHGIGFEHHAQPKVVSITQATELGTVYTLDEIRDITAYAHSKDLLVHMDGARLANAAVFLETDLKTITADAGIDILSFGGTKNGMMFGEAVVFFEPKLTHDFRYIRKQGMQLHSKMRFIAAQFEALLRDDLWHTNAQHANHMAQKLATELAAIPQIQITQQVKANGVFAIVPEAIIPSLQEAVFFYVWDEARSEVRWMTAFDTTEADIDNFVALVRNQLKMHP